LTLPRYPPLWLEVVQLLETLLPKVSDMERGIPVPRAAGEQPEGREEKFPLPLSATHLTLPCC